MAFLSASGKMIYLRVHDRDSGYGPQNDRLDGEVVFQLSDQADHSMGFTLRNDGDRPAHQAMLDLLRDAFNHGWTVHTEYELPSGKKNGIATRVWLTRPPAPRARVLRRPLVVGPAEAED